MKTFSGSAGALAAAKSELMRRVAMDFMVLGALRLFLMFESYRAGFPATPYARTPRIG
jgi:hypothetical protein